MATVSVIMPTYDQARFLPRALDSLLAQSFEDWELVIVDDASPDDARVVAAPWLADARIRLERLPSNRGLGAALNAGLDLTTAPLVSYLPSDDVLYLDHLASLVDCFADSEVVLAFSGVRHHYNRFAAGAIPGYPLQLVQVMHRRTQDPWVEREALVTDDLGVMLWDRLTTRGTTAATGRVSCEWVDHPDQLHKVIREPEGGINPYRVRFEVPFPMRFKSTVGNLIDEVGQYRRFRERPDTPPGDDSLSIVLAGELAYNADRVLALEERGHRLFGLWMDEPYWYNTVGPLPFGHVEDLPRRDWRKSLRDIDADVIYALLNWQAVPFLRHVLDENPGVPFVWHFKEGPFICLEKGTWNSLVELYQRADGIIWSSPEMRDWFCTVEPSLGDDGRPSLVLDGDLPKQEWLEGEVSRRLSDVDGELHTVVPGRPIGLHPPDVAALAAAGIHLHFYGDFTHGQWRGWIETTSALAPEHLHLHAQVDQAEWVHEFSRYDAGWLHFFESGNGGEIRRANWDDLNYPARLAALVVSGLPVLQRDNPGSIVATQELVRNRDIGLFFTDMEQLASLLGDEGRLETVRRNVWRQRADFSFDAHAEDLVSFFRQVMTSPRFRS